MRSQSARISLARSHGWTGGKFAAKLYHSDFPKEGRLLVVGRIKPPSFDVLIRPLREEHVLRMIDTAILFLSPAVSCS
jgi:hypothetical protein